MKLFQIIPAVAFCSATFTAAQTFPLSENFWSNPEFQQRVMGSYGVHSGLEPKLNSEEAAFFTTLITAFEADLETGALMLESRITRESSAALDFMLGTVRLQMNQLPGAIESYQEAIRKFPNFMRAYKNLGMVYAQSGDFEAAAKMLVKGLELGGGDGLSYGLLGYSYLNQERYASALNAYNLAMTFEPQTKDWKLGKVRCLVELEMRDEAAGLIRELITSDPNNAELYLHQANIALAREQPLAAMADLELVRRMGKGTEASLFLLGDIYVNQGMFGLSLPAYDEALAATAEPVRRFDTVSRALRSLIEHEEWENARRLLAVAEARFGTVLKQEQQLALLNLTAEVELGAHNDARAAETLERIIEVDPMNGRALLLLARFYWKEGDTEEAAFLFNRASGIEAVAANALLQHGRMLVEQKDYHEAAKLLRQSLDLHYESNVADYLRAVEEAARQS